MVLSQHIEHRVAETEMEQFIAPVTQVHTVVAQNIVHSIESDSPMMYYTMASSRQEPSNPNGY